MYFMDYVEDEKDDARKKGIKEGIITGSENTKIANARKMLEDGKLSNEDVAKYSDLPLEKIKELATEICVSVK